MTSYLRPGLNPFGFPRPSSNPFGGFGGMGQQFGGGIGPLAPLGKAISRQSVSYTHLTLPTKA